MEAEERIELLRGHAPRLHFDSLGLLRPAAIDDYRETATTLPGPGGDSPRLDPLPGHPELDGPRRSRQLLRSYGAGQDLRDAGLCYGRVVEDGEVAFLQYWFFYVDNPCVVDPGRHDGDWEFAQVRV